MTNTTELTAEMIDSLGVSLSGLECQVHDLCGNKFSGYSLKYAQDGFVVAFNGTHERFHKVTVPTHALVVKVLEQLERIALPDAEEAFVVVGGGQIGFATNSKVYSDHFEDVEFANAPSWFCSLFTKARKDAGWVVEL
jgi:hypothetical protein